MAKRHGNRTKKKATLSELSRKPLAKEDFEKTYAELLGPSDRACALVCATMVETALTQALVSHFPLRDEAHIDFLFWREGAPLGTFASKIAIGRAIGIFGDNLEQLLSKIRKIRNAFAHSVNPLSFSNEIVSKECEWLFEGSLRIEHTLSPQRERYVAVCSDVAVLLGDHATKQSKLPAKICIPDV